MLVRELLDRHSVGQEVADNGAASDMVRNAGLAGNERGARDLLAALLPIRERTSGTDHPHARATRDALAHWTEATSQRG